jgi:hypothetical protein
MPRKVFTAGEVLAAADVNEFLMDQSVQSFAGTAARGSAIPSPVEGMVTYLEDIDDLSTYNGSSWVSPYGMTFLRTQSVAPGSSTVNIDGVFTSDYRNYMLVFNLVGTDDTVLRFRMRSGTSTISGANYTRQLLTANDSSITGVRVVNDTLASIADLSSVSSTSLAYMFDPAVAQQTTTFYTSNVRTTMLLGITAGRHTLSTAYDGISVFPDSVSTISGTISIYGLRS